MCSIYATRRVLIASNIIFIAEKLKQCRFSKPFFPKAEASSSSSSTDRFPPTSTPGGLYKCRCPLQSPRGHRTTSLSGLSSSGCPLHANKVTVQLLSQGCPLQAVLSRLSSSAPQGHRSTSLSGLSSSGTRGRRTAFLSALSSSGCSSAPTRSPYNFSLNTVLFWLSSSGCSVQAHKVTVQRLSQSCPLKDVLSVALPGLASQGCAYTRSPYNLSHRAVLFRLSSPGTQCHRTTLSELSSSGCPLHLHKVTVQRLS